MSIIFSLSGRSSRISWSSNTIWPSSFSGSSRFLYPIRTRSQNKPLDPFVPTGPVSPTVPVTHIGPLYPCVPAGLYSPFDPVGPVSQGSCHATQQDNYLTLSYQYQRAILICCMARKKTTSMGSGKISVVVKCKIRCTVAWISREVCDESPH